MWIPLYWRVYYMLYLLHEGITVELCKLEWYKPRFRKEASSLLSPGSLQGEGQYRELETTTMKIAMRVLGSW